MAGHTTPTVASVENRLLIATATRLLFMPAMPRHPVTLSSFAAGPASDAGTDSTITYGMAVACMSHVCARMRPVGDTAQISEQPPGSSVGAGFQLAGSGSRSRRSV